MSRPAESVGPALQGAEVKARVATPPHPVARCLADLTGKDECYYRLKFAGPEGSVTSMLRVPIGGKDETVAWAWERPDGGRSFGFSGLHFHANRKLPEYRRMVTQGALWAMKRPIPEAGSLRD